ncbi:MAG TPA: CBS domain-containing protein [Acidimicrobiales bacterium]
MRAISTIRKPLITIDCDRTVTEAARLMDEHAVGALIVTDDNDRLAGIVTDRDIVVRGVARRIAPDARIDSVMTTQPVTIPADADVRDALPLFRTHAVRRAVIVDGDRPLGLVSVDDLLIDLVSDLSDLVRPVTGQVLFGHPEPSVPATA